MKKTILAALILLSPLTVWGYEGDVVEIVFSGTSATVTIPSTADVTCQQDGAHVQLTSSTTTEEYTYKLSGTTPDGSLTITGQYKLTLELAGVDITSQRGAAIDVESGKRVAVLLGEGTVNHLADSPGGSHKAALYFKGHPEFEGPGVLNVIGRTAHAISAKEYLQLKRTTGTINILSAVKDGIHCGKGIPDTEHNCFQMSGGVLNIADVGSDCIDSDDYGIMKITGGVINANVDKYDGAGLKCDSIIYLSGGQLNIDVSGEDAVALRANYALQLTGGILTLNISGNGSKGIKAKHKTSEPVTVADGGYLTLGGTDCTIYVHADDIPQDTTIVNARAISADKDIHRTGGLVEIFGYGQMKSPYHTDGTDTDEGGELIIHRAPWRFYHGDFQYDMTSYVVLYADGQPVSDYFDLAVGAFLGDACVGVALDGYLRLYANSASAQSPAFRVYDYAAGREYVASATPSVTFAANSLAGSPSSPVRLNYWTVGDVNRDGLISIADVTALVNIILGKDDQEPYLYDHVAADVNRDGLPSIADVTALVNIILGK